MNFRIFIIFAFLVSMVPVAVLAENSSPMALEAIVQELPTANRLIVLDSSGSFGTVNLSPSRIWIDGVTNTPNAVANPLNDPWLACNPVLIRMKFNNNVPGDLVIYTNHPAQTYFPTGMPADRDINGMINPLYVARNPFTATVPMRAWADLNNAGTVTTNPSAEWVWITDASKSEKQKLIPYTNVRNDSVGVYIRPSFSWPKLPGNYVAKVIIEFNRY